MKSNFLNISICVLVLILVGAACSSFTKGKEAGERAVAKFHERLDAEKYDEIYADLADEFKKVSSEEDAKQLFEAVHRKLGKVKNAQLVAFNTNTTTQGSFTVLNYETEFELDKGTETFTFVVNGDDAKIAGYHTNSKAFMK
ncbi:MAG TPA: DUF4019 domain-containing protein [Pyrinomonadaceae bacterium]|nr:DUF4019 domain-containing protein [Pyrinomonadaceae bacterium]